MRRALFLLAGLCWSAQAADPHLTPTLRTQLLRIDAPRGAQRVTSGPFLSKAQATLTKVAAANKLKCAKTEVLVWQRSPVGGLDLLRELVQTARVYKWNYSEPTTHPANAMVIAFTASPRLNMDVLGIANWGDDRLTLGLCQTATPIP